MSGPGKIRSLGLGQPVIKHIKFIQNQEICQQMKKREGDKTSVPKIILAHKYLILLYYFLRPLAPAYGTKVKRQVLGVQRLIYLIIVI